ncbi:MAG TPA: 3'-5' exonuclease, partial [Desulfobacteria bacterium]|nr:3'-5' exonuclease [Desulfobacteria bacterium]
MSLRFILGRAGTGKTHTCLEEIRQAVRQAPDGPPLILLVPEQATFQTESELTATPGLQGIMRVQVLSFHRLAYRVLLEAGGCARRHLGELGKHMLLREFLERRRQELKVFQRSARQTGFVEVLAKAISELKAYEISPGELNGSIEELGKNRGMDVLADKLTDLQLIYRDLQAYLADKYVDPDDYLELLAERIPESDTIRGAEIWLDGFTGFTPVEYTVLRAVLRVATQVNVSLCLDSRSRAKEEGDLFFTTRETEDKLTKLAREWGIPLAKSTVLDEKIPRRLRGFPVGAYLESAFYHRSAPVWASETAKIQLAAAVNRRAEVEGAAREIIRLGREEGYRWRDISLALRDLEPYKDLIPTVFSDYGIPYFIDKKRTVMHHPLVELVRSALETVLADWGYDPVFRYLKTDLVPLSREQVDRLENYVLAHGVHGRRWIDGRPWDYCRRYTLGEDSEPSKAELDELNQINQDRVQAVAALATLETAIKDAKTVREYTTALFGLLDDLQVAKTLEEWCKQAESSGQLEKAREHSQIWQEVMDLFDQIVQALGDESLSLENYAQVLNAGLESLRLGLIPPGFDQVLVNSLDRSRNPNVRAVFVLGANDGVLPAKVESTGIFTEQEREELEKTGLDLAPGGRRRLFEEQFIVYTALTRASDRLWVSYPLADEEGKALMPS